VSARENSGVTRPDALLAVARDALAEAGLPEAEVYLSHVRRGMARFAVSEVGQHAEIDEPEAQVRVASGSRVGEASTNGLTKEGVVRALRQAARLAEVSPPRDPFAGFARADEGAPGELPAPERWSAKTAEASPVERAEALAPVLRTIRDAGLVAAGALQTLSTSVAVATTHGVARGHRSTVSAARVWALETAGAGGASGFDSAIARDLPALGLQALAERAVRDARDAERAPRGLPAGTYDVVLEAEAVASLLEWLGHIAFGGVEVEQGSSLLSGRLGERVTGERVTISDDPLADHPALCVSPFDREGSPRRRVVCIERGVAREVLHDRTTALRAGTRTTGSGVTGWGRGVTPAPSALHMEGDSSETGAENVDELVRRMGRGLHVRRFHYVNGFLEPRRAVMTGLTRDGTFLVEGGRRVASVGNLRFTDSITEAFGRIEAATREARAVGSHYADETAIRAPALLVRGLTFTSGTPPR
jgi:PmbA protein